MADKRKCPFDGEDELTPKKQRTVYHQLSPGDEEPLTPANQTTKVSLMPYISPAKQTLYIPKEYKIINDGLYGHIR